MCISFFKLDELEPIKILQDILRIVRDILALTNDFIHIKLLDDFIEFINVSLGDTQSDIRKLI